MMCQQHAMKLDHRHERKTCNLCQRRDRRVRLLCRVAGTMIIGLAILTWYYFANH
jgi:hypothetical protein